ncbi:XRE family transcriptional regulator [Alicyclobacillus cellulosilyticus]|uniref:XRE family transcriptional regulator n=1 Tax=Alicyclobacillus cellulosilyticus TaxID=1003997 RepID=A0A917NIV0_9BACL|nr:helix-turn-helix domain-containing protein [Alicyclobacillus cellulosilyticus]GGJ04554.1 XRE family transcriptional regulator [Alicyclobacillus cellulosilyticus]
MEDERLRELGMRLKRERERLGLDLGRVQAETKIRTRYLEAIEAGDWSVLPGEVYARGFVRTYARFLGLDGSALLREFLDSSDQPSAMAGNTSAPGPNPDRTPASAQPTGQGVSMPRSGPSKAMPSARVPAASAPPVYRTRRRAADVHRTPRGWAGQVFVVAGILVLLAGGVWYLNRHPGGRATTGTPAPTQTPNTQTGSGAGGTSHSHTGMSNTARHPKRPTSPAPLRTTVIAAPFDPHRLVQTYAVATTLPLSVTMSVTSPCWVSVSADGQTVDVSEILQPGSPRSWQGEQTVSIRLGHVQGVQLSVNGQQVPLPATNAAIDVVFNRTPPGPPNGQTGSPSAGP